MISPIRVCSQLPVTGSSAGPDDSCWARIEPRAFGTSAHPVQDSGQSTTASVGRERSTDESSSVGSAMRPGLRRRTAEGKERIVRSSFWPGNRLAGVDQR